MKIKYFLHIIIVQISQEFGKTNRLNVIKCLQNILYYIKYITVFINFTKVIKRTHMEAGVLHSIFVREQQIDNNSTVSYRSTWSKIKL